MREIEQKWLYDGKYYDSYDEAREALGEYEELRTADCGYRPAVADDIQIGVMVYLKIEEGHVPLLIDELLHYGAPYKAFCADDGCRYGLDRLFIMEPKK